MDPDLDLMSSILQPPQGDPDPDAPLEPYLNYVGFRRLLLSRKAQLSPSFRRKDWRCNGRGYVAYRNFIRRPRNWERSHDSSSQSNTPGNSGRWASPHGPQSILLDVDIGGSSRDFRVNSSFSRRTSFGSSFSDSDRTVHFVEPAYSFVGMHCVFDRCRSSVTVLKFGHMSSDLLAYGASDGSLTVCDISEPPSVLQHLNGHTKDITGDVYMRCSGDGRLRRAERRETARAVARDAGWPDGDSGEWRGEEQHGEGAGREGGTETGRAGLYIASTSLDKTVRVWGIAKGHCMRVIYGVSSQLCIRFHPVNNNLLSVGNANREITVFNFSTGRVVHKALFEKEITAIDNDHTGQLIFAGDAQGCVYTVSVNSHTGLLSRTHRHRSSNKSKSPITTIQYRTFSLSTRGPVLLVCAQDGNLYFFSVALEIQGYLTQCCSLKLAPRVHRIHASFCPLLSLEKGEFIVSGSEDSNVYFYDLTRPKHTCVNKLQGHGAPVIGVAWNQGENMLASSDSEGMVIVWKRAKSAG